MFGRCESSPCVFEFNGNFLQGALLQNERGPAENLTEGLSALSRRPCAGEEK